MNDKELNYILAIAEHKSISKAAARLYLSQPSLSQVLGNVEKELGRKLFERSSYGLFLNEYGKKYVEAAAEILGLYRNMEEYLYDLNGFNSGKISFGLPLALSSYLLPMILSKFRDKYPDFIIEYHEVLSGEVERMVQNGRIDFGIMHMEKPLPDIHYELLVKEDIYFVAAEDHPLNQKYRGTEEEHPLVNLRDFCDEDFILVRPNTKTREISDLILKKAGISPAIKYTTHDIETAKQMAAAGLGVTFIPRCYLNLHSREGGIRCYRLSQGLYPSWHLAIAYPKQKYISNADRVFIGVLKEELASL